MLSPVVCLDIAAVTLAPREEMTQDDQRLPGTQALVEAIATVVHLEVSLIEELEGCLMEGRLMEDQKGVEGQEAMDHQEGAGGGGAVGVVAMDHMLQEW